MRYYGPMGCVLVMMLGLAGCGHLYVQHAAEPLDEIIVRESGFGTFVSEDQNDLIRQRLNARRASRLDAYRNLAERVYGTAIYGGSTVNEFVLENDRFRSYVDSYIRGAKVIAVNELDDGVVETVMELALAPSFRHCVSRVAPANVAELCQGRRSRLTNYGYPDTYRYGAYSEHNHSFHLNYHHDSNNHRSHDPIYNHGHVESLYYLD